MRLLVVILYHLFTMSIVLRVMSLSVDTGSSCYTAVRFGKACSPLCLRERRSNKEERDRFVRIDDNVCCMTGYLICPFA